MKRKQTAAPMPSQFVAPPMKREPPPAIAVPDIDVSPVWAGIADDSRDSVSAQDRSKAFLIRNAPMYFVAVTTAIVATLAYSLVAIALKVEAPWLMDRLLIFLIALAAFTYVTHLAALKKDYEHSRAGVERLRIEKGYAWANDQLRSRERITEMAYKQLTQGEDE